MMIKWLVRLSFPALGLLLLLMIFGLKSPDQTPEPAVESAPSEIPAFEALVPSPILTEGPDIVFKWQSDDGSWHFADQPPTQGSWNTLAIEREEKNRIPDRAFNPETEWESPYNAPFSLSPRAISNGS
ncbi:MAG TPA: DUF4124 domain-containing protein [Marinobacter sp.]|uniref:DUF4124 domain-containing protein n=2 Tax=root TaxID=1 RepID=A0A831R5L4_9GAMM|nr:DUF4124 domain-containing protein [Marinobacter antarcticus]HDZ37552.1 DUF4124 domain-containing protein [Marinobacter sp.]HEA54176.1 DUF4124 domain-containing protein [Marinobacter antarcticus]